MLADRALLQVHYAVRQISQQQIHLSLIKLILAILRIISAIRLVQRAQLHSCFMLHDQRLHAEKMLLVC